MKELLTLASPVYRVYLILVFTTFNYVHSQSWTFNNPGISYIGFSPQYSSGQSQNIELKFRTRQPNGLLFHHYLLPFDKNKFPLLYQYELYAEIRQGYLRIGHQVNQYSQLLTLGQGLNDDKWHSLSWDLDSSDGLMSVKLDNETKSLSLEVYSWGSGKEILKWSQLTSIISFGATNMSESQEFFYFIGCLADLKYSREDGILIAVPIQKISGVTQGCRDLCTGSNPCQNGGRCINMYTTTKCDCFGTNYEGSKCENKGATTMTFRGYEWIQYKLYNRKEDKLFSDQNRISLEFKTGRGSGILLYAVGGTPYHTHVTASLHSGKLHTSISFGDTSNDLEFTMGLQLDNNRWHNLTIIHNKRDIFVYLDGDNKYKEITAEQYFLSLDPNVYIGGGDNFVETRGLQVTRSFVGCLRNVYFNDDSVLHSLKTGKASCEYQGGLSVQYGCDAIQEIPITFPIAGSMLQWDVPREKELTVSFRFRTVREVAVLFSMELLARDGLGGYEYGYLEVWVKDGKPFLDFVPSTRNKENFRENQSIPSLVNNSQWHTLDLSLHSSQAKLKVDQVSIRTNVYRKTLEHQGKLVFGYGIGLRRYKRSEGFVGCLEGLVIQGKSIDPISIMESDRAVGLVLDGCNLIDYCSNNNICQHGSICLSDWEGVRCDCSEHYEGKACHFPKYPRTCDEYFQSGRNMSGIYMVDLDGSGPLLPAHVECQMSKIHDQHEYGETIIEHNFNPNTTVRQSSYADRQYHLSYRGMSAAQLYALTSVSAKCEQYIKYECYNSPMELGKKTWFKAANGEIVDYIGSNRAGFCNCLPGEEMCSGERCYCDRGLKEWDQDSGINKNKAQLPLTEVTVLQYPTGTGNLTIGHLKCWGSVQVPLEKSITFIKSSSYVMLHSWKSGDLHINIKTDQTNALILYQTPGKGMGNKFSIKIVSANEVQFHYVINGKSILKTIYTPISFDTGEWHTIIVEHDKYNLRLSVDQSRSLYTLRSDIDNLIDFSDGILYIGGLPDGIAGELGETGPGLTGCVRGFVYNDKEKDLSRLIDGSMTGVTTDCMSSCWPNPCLNGGVCEENWGSYNCICANKWIHYGNDCERDINRDAVTLSGSETSFMVFDTSEYPEALHQTIIFSFRTFKKEALLLYLHDEMNNFVQFELQKGTMLIISYNNYNEVIRESITFDIDHKLSDGKWKQVIGEVIVGDSTRLQVEDKTILIQYPRLKLRNYNTFPYKESSIPESVFLSIPSEKPVPFIHLYVGGVPNGATSLPTFNGCLRGLKIGKRIYNLREQGIKAKAGDVTTACETGCIEDRCLNGGYCTEYFKLGEFDCDCSETDYSGLQCQIEPSGKFYGNSVIEQTFSLPLIDQRSLSEQLSFTFISDGVDPSQYITGEIIEMAMIYVTSSKKKDYLLAKLEQDGSVMIETNQEIGIYRMKIPVDFANGKAHELRYKRDGSDMFVTIDGIEEATMNYAAFDLDDIDSIYVGGMAQQTDDFYSVVNFTGCISNVVYTPSKTSSIRIRPLKDFYTNSTDIKVLGDSVSTCSDKRPNIHGGKASHTPNPPPDEFTDFETVTMPEWNIGPAKVEIIGGMPIPPTDIIITTQSLIIPKNNTSTLLTDYRVENMTIVITACIIALCLILAIIIALLLVRRRRRLGEYELKKKIVMDDDVDAKVPLNHVTSTPVPNDHLAKLDEFSMVSATLGPPKMRNNVAPDQPNRLSEGSFPMIDDETAFTSTIYNKRKNRPASSISEVLEELERRQKNIKDPSTDEICKELEENLKRELELNRAHGEGELEWDPQIDKAPLTYGEITFFNTPLLLSIPDELEELEMSPSSSIHSLEKKEEDDIVTEGSENPNSNGEYNGDSGYEAESSRPEGLESIEDSATPDTTIDESPTKLYYDISGIELQDSPNLSVHQKLLPAQTRT